MNNSSLIPEKVPELWFTDADVVFQAGSKLFRVHRSILSARSTIFNDMFSVPHPDSDRIVDADGSYTHIHLPDDAIDVHHFFLAIFDASYFEPPPSDQPTSVVVSILRLAHKYDVVFLKRRAVAHLNVLFPTEWDGLWKLMIENDHTTAADNLSLLELAPAIEIPWVLPAVHFLLATTSINLIFNLEAWNLLEASIQRNCLIKRENCMSELAVSSRWIWSHTTAPSCLSVGTCTNILGLIQKMSGIWKVVSDIPSVFCKKCSKTTQAKCYTSGAQVWDGLPKLIGLGSWEDLNSAKKSFDN
ncbi:hypothetical protein HYPSUDRAFT_180410 [Hypholoma sublateritium FD-334 SS-4]|uniref:BTB domain-containing protein n=1 Tax=Hypholoma sublateritium (strain FD-334 SS-4) TaxID=945553 RepID=A0A0D2P7B9_HYPSF|nr:hypothetical protein HYPSUDRAFT_180410 [Hypholoma sublateritium FD-334 SS-4]